MLTKFFATTKPATIIVVLGYMTLGFFYAHRDLFTISFSWIYTLKVVAMWLLFVLAMFTLNFVAQKNELTKRSTYRILLYAAFGLALPAALRDGGVLLAGVLILIALRRVVSLRSGLQMERKIFDATFWILLASLAFFYSWLFLIVVYLTLVFYRSSNIRYVFIPVIALLCFLVLGYTFMLYQAGAPQDVIIDLPSVSFDFVAYNNPQVLIAIAFILGTLLWTIWSYLIEQRRASSTLKSRYAVVLAILVVSFLVILVAPEKSGAAWYFTLPAVAIIVSTYLENMESLLFKESLLWLIVILPIVIYFV